MHVFDESLFLGSRGNLGILVGRRKSMCSRATSATWPAEEHNFRESLGSETRR